MMETNSDSLLRPYYYANKPTCPRCGQELTKVNKGEFFSCPTCGQQLTTRKGENNVQGNKKLPGSPRN